MVHALRQAIVTNIIIDMKICLILMNCITEIDETLETVIGHRRMGDNYSRSQKQQFFLFYFE